MSILHKDHQNSRHPTIKFTYVAKENDSIEMLGTRISRGDKGVYHKLMNAISASTLIVTNLFNINWRRVLHFILSVKGLAFPLSWSRWQNFFNLIHFKQLYQLCRKNKNILKEKECIH